MQKTISVGLVRFCGVDVAYDGDAAHCSAVVMEGKSVVESADLKIAAINPYVPGLLMLEG